SRFAPCLSRESPKLFDRIGCTLAGKLAQLADNTGATPGISAPAFREWSSPHAVTRCSQRGFRFDSVWVRAAVKIRISLQSALMARTFV
ncbi:MAG: hypothetical protein WCB50_24335, partial [Pseudolabrys sp.]